MTEHVQLAALRCAGFVVAAIALALTVYLARDQPLVVAGGLGTISSLISWYVGKSLGTPVPQVTLQALQSWPPAKALEIVKKHTAQPARAEEVMVLLTRAIESMAPPPRDIGGTPAVVEILNAKEPPND
jgi:hypothetical protein